MEPALKTMIDNMPEKTGKSLEEWKEILKTKSFDKHSEGVNFLKSEYKVTHGFANTIVTLSKESELAPEDLVERQYEGKKNLFPIYEALINFIKTLGTDITITPKKGSVSVIRNRQFVLIKPATKTRIDLGIKLTGKPLTNRLENSGPFGTMCTHRVKTSNPSEVDNELKAWITEAYQASN